MSTPHNDAIKAALTKATPADLEALREDSPDVIVRLLADAELHRRKKITEEPPS